MSPSSSNKNQPHPCDIAIIGMGCLFPKAPDVETYWENILNKINTIIEVPEDRWDWKKYYSEDRYAKDKVYSKWGAFIDDIRFDPLHHGIPPNSLASIEPLQLLALEVVSHALDDAGYDQRGFPRDRTAVIFGISGSGEHGQKYCFRSSLPMFFGNFSEEIAAYHRDHLPTWTEDSFPGILTNVTAGRIANRFDLGGVNCTIDAACASSLSALYMSVRELEAGTSDMVIAGGADCTQNPFAYLCFSKTQALSPRGISAPFDDHADGIVLGEGLAAIILKRLSDARRDGDKIYAVIKGVGASSDGRDKSLTAPRPEGQVRALQRAYAQAGISPRTVGLIEAHATGTAVGDRVEIESMNKVFMAEEAAEQTCAVGSVKSMIGHTKSTAGLASLIKAALSLHHKTLPATLGVSTPNKGLQIPGSPFYVNTTTKPWLNHGPAHPRRAGVSAFGFGGTNYHIVLEEYADDNTEDVKEKSFSQWPCELLVWEQPTLPALLAALLPLKDALAQGAAPPLKDLAYTIYQAGKASVSGQEDQAVRLAVVAGSLHDLQDKLTTVITALQASRGEIFDTDGIYLSAKPDGAKGKLAFLFPGQGSQYPHMFADLVIQFPEMRDWFERADKLVADKLDRPLSSYIFPVSAPGAEERRICEADLARPQITQPALGTAALAMYQLLQSLGITPDMAAGHSYGEYVALAVAGVFSTEDVIRIAEARGRFIAEAASADPGTMAAAGENEEVVADIIKDIDGVWIANINSPKQTVISGRTAAVAEAEKTLKSRGVATRRFPIGSAFHSPVVAPANERLTEFLARVKMNKPAMAVYSNTTARRYPDETEAVRSLLVSHLVNRVDFVNEIEAMYADGARIFVEVGPGKVLANLVSKILQDRPHLALISNQADRPGLSQLQHLLGQFIVHGGQVNREKLYQGRALRPIDLDALYRETNRYGVTATTWLVNGARAIPFTEAMTAAPKNTVKPMEVTSDMTTIKHEGSAAEYPGSATSGMSAAAPPVTSKEYVMVQHQKLMQRLLDMHQSVMTSYMNGLAAGSTTLLPAQAVAAREAALPVDATTGTVPQAALPAAPKPAGDSLPKSDPGDNGGMPADRQTKAALLRIVSERTGYPEDMLDLDLNLEADLGIDSIKRVEILTRLTEVMFPNGHEESLEQIEEINLSKTLREIMGHIEKFMAAAGKSGSAEAPAPLPEKTAAGAARYDENLLLPRFTLTAVDAPIQDSAFALAQDRVTIITDDEGGIARSLQEKLTATGYPAVILRWGKGRAQSEEPVYFLNNLAAEEITTVVQSIRQQHGRVGGLIHLFPLKKGPSFADIDLPGWTARLDYEVTSLFLLLKHLEPDLRQAAQNGGAVVMSAVDMGGTFASGVNTNNNNFFPGHGGISGLLKTAAIEMPPVRVKLIDLDPAESAADIAEKLFTEIGVADHCLEIGYAGKKRMRLDLVAAALQSRQDNGLRMDSSWVILMTGGARGITAQIALDLARKYQPKLILAGRSLPPSAAESAATAGVEQPEALKKIIIDTMRQQGENFSLVDVENEYRRLRREREMRSNIAAMRRAGSEVEYCQVDVRDEEAFGGLIDDIYERHGNIHAVIHGAGVIEDKLIKDKTLASFDRVLGTKTQSAFILSKKLRPESLKLLVLFSSVAGRFGNQGQCDYAAANEVMNKLAVYLNKRWPGRVVSINWGPWDQSGMVSDGLRQEFARRGVRLIPPAAGSLFMDTEIKKGERGEVELVVGDGPWGAAGEAPPV